MKKAFDRRLAKHASPETTRASAALDIQPDGAYKLDPCKKDGDKCKSGIEEDIS